MLGGAAAALSITRLEGSRWRGGRLWSWNRDPGAWSKATQATGAARATPARLVPSEREGLRSGRLRAVVEARHTDTTSWTPTRSSMARWRGGPRHDVSKHHVIAASRCAERMGPIRITAPQRVQLQVARVSRSVVDDGVSAVGVGGVASAVRAFVIEAVRHVLAKKPDWRIRTKPRGKMCWTKRRRNSMAVSVIARRRLPWA